MNALVISGGGSKGAYAGGVAEFLINNCGRDYQLFVGTSTGSLLAPLLAVGAIDRLRKIFTAVRQNDIFNVCPFLIKKTKVGYRTSINHLGVIKMFLRRKKTFGESENLRKLIRKTFTKNDFEKLRDSGKLVIVTVANLTLERVEYKSSNDYEYEDFCDWIWASANLLPFMSLYIKDYSEYGDGGFGNVIPIQQAINLGATSVDVIALRPVDRSKSNLPSRNAFNVLTKTYDFMLNQIGLDDLIIGNLEAAHRAVEVHYYHTPRILTEHIFIFDPVALKRWWREGYELAMGTTPATHCLQPGKRFQSGGNFAVGP